MMTFEQVKCETPDLAKQNLEKLKALFPTTGRYCDYYR